MADNPLLAPAQQLLTSRGFARPGQDEIWVRSAAPGKTGVVWLNAVRRSRFVDLSRKIGIRYERLTEQVLELTGLKGPLPWTHWQSLYSLHPTTMPPGWSIVIKGEEERNAVYWDWFAHQLDEYGEQWLARYADPEQMKAAMRSLEAGGFSRVTLPVLLWLEGDADGAREAVAWGRSLDVNGAPVLDYDGFAERLITEIEARPHGPADRRPGGVRDG